MSRKNHLPGLTQVALKKLGHNVREIGVRILPNGDREEFDRVVHVRREDIHVEIIGEIQGAFGAGVIAKLHRYTFPSGVVYDEYLQVAPWHGGPHFFLALRRPSGKFLKTTLWPRSETGMSEDMNNCGAYEDLTHSNS